MREESSSSQNVNLFIASITERGSSGEGFTVRLSEGSSFFVSSQFIHGQCPPEGSEINDEQLALLEGEDERVKALHKAGDLLSRAEQSSGGLLIKLRKKGFSEEACRLAVDRVIELGLLDDERFSRLWISSRLRSHPEGRNMLYQGLVSRGAGSRSARKAIDETLTDEDFLEAVLKAGNKLHLRYGDDDQKLRQGLYRRGFSNSEIQYYFESREI